jgi:hypothetical protein
MRYFKVIKVERVFNLGNFQSERVGVEIELTPEESPESAYWDACHFIERHNLLKTQEDARSARSARLPEPPIPDV